MEALEKHLSALMREALCGDEQAYRRLLTDSADRLRAYYARRLHQRHDVVDDLVQETLIAVHTRRHTYDTGRPFTAWLHAIARYKLVDHFRQAGQRVSVPPDDAEYVLGSDDTQASLARADVNRLLETVPERSRELVRAVKIEGRSVAEAAAEAGMSESAVKVTIHRALKRLSRRLRREDTA